MFKNFKSADMFLTFNNNIYCIHTRRRNKGGKNITLQLVPHYTSFITEKDLKRSTENKYKIVCVGMWMKGKKESRKGRGLNARYICQSVRYNGQAVMDR